MPRLISDDAQLLLELLDLPAQRGLRDVQDFRRPAEAPLACHGDEIPEVPQLHLDTSRVYLLTQSVLDAGGSTRLSIR